MSYDQSAEIAKLHASVAALREASFQHFGTTPVLECLLLTLVETHPNPAELLRRFEQNLEPQHARFLAECQVESGLRHFQETAQRLTSACRQLLLEPKPGEVPQ